MTTPQMPDEELWPVLLQRLNVTEQSVIAAVQNAALRSLAKGNRDYESAEQIVRWLYPWLRWTLCGAFRKDQNVGWLTRPRNFEGYCFRTVYRELNRNRDEPAAPTSRRTDSADGPREAAKPVVTYQDPASLTLLIAASKGPLPSVYNMADELAEQLKQLLGSFDQLKARLTDYQPETDVEMFRAKYFARPRQTDVEVAAAFGVSKNTVRNRMVALFRVLSVRLTKEFGLEPRDVGKEQERETH